jgi:pyruvate dehydrogenase E2 component (dihydrolipoamide acetyltransferase)
MLEVKLPNLGEGIVHGAVVRVSVATGQSVIADQTLIELETDKALIEVPSPQAGQVAEIKVREGEVIDVGQVILVLVETTEAELPSASELTNTERNKQAVESNKAERQTATEALPQLTRESAKPQASPLPTDAGTKPETESAAPAHGSGDRTNGQLRTMPERLQLPALAATSVDASTIPSAAGPTTRRMARELGVDLGRVQGSGRGGRVTQDDVRAYVQTVMQAPAVSATAQPQPDLPDFSRWGEITAESLNAVRRTTAAHLGHSWQLVPQVTQFDTADITLLDAMRLRFSREAAERDVHLTLTVLLLKALCTALLAQPRFNSSLDLAQGQLILKHYIHIGVAVDTARGLLVPVLRDVDQKDVWQLASELQALTARARDGHLDLSELRGASFTLSNQGAVGGTFFTPLVNHPEVAILGVGQARIQPAWDSKTAQAVPRLTLPLALSYDHCALDGADAARFITRLKRSLEDPERMLLGL